VDAAGLFKVEIGGGVAHPLFKIRDRRVGVMSGETVRRAKPDISGGMVLLMDRARRRRQRSSHPHLPHGRLRLRSHWRGGEMFFYTPVFNMAKQRKSAEPATPPVALRKGVIVWVPAESSIPPLKGAATSP
jgi:hypothetical protein